MHVSSETRRQTHERLSRVLGAARMKVLTGTYAFVESPLSRAPDVSAPDTLAWVRDDEVWSQLVPSCDTSRDLFTIFRFHFEDGLDNSGFVGWLASQLKARVGTGVFVVCGQNSRHGGIFDYWGCPVRVTAQVLDEIETLVSKARTNDQLLGDELLDGVRMGVVATGALGQIGAGTILEFDQRGATVYGHYAGGKIRVGQLVGTMTGRNLEFRFAQVDDEGVLHGGHSRCEIERMGDGRLRLVEHFQWESREGSGTNVLEELADRGFTESRSRRNGRRTMRSRRVDVFFYGLFMDQDLLRGKGLAPMDAELASAPGFALRIGQRAALAREAGRRAHGVVMSLTLDEVELLYSDPSVKAYRPEAVLVELAGGTVAALCYNLPQPPSTVERNPEYAAKLRSVGEKVGLPAEYVASIA